MAVADWAKSPPSVHHAQMEHVHALSLSWCDLQFPPISCCKRNPTLTDSSEAPFSLLPPPPALLPAVPAMKSWQSVRASAISSLVQAASSGHMDDLLTALKSISPVYAKLTSDSSEGVSMSEESEE